MSEVDIRSVIIRVVMNNMLKIMKEFYSNVTFLTIMSSLSESGGSGEDILAQALSLPLPVKSIKLDKDKIVVEIGEEAGTSR
ncbi:MAG: hypothetical protein QXW41_08065 [Fervidicoccaceae archaeon]